MTLRSPPRRRHPAGKWFAFLVLAFLAGCSPAPETDRLTFVAFGTLVDVTLHPSGSHDLARIESELAAELEAMHESWHAWRPGSLGRTNEQLARGTVFPAPPSVLPLIERAREIEDLSNGLFNPALGRLIAAWGFHQDEPSGPPPDPAWIESWLLNTPRMAHIVIEGERLRGLHPELQLDFGGMAKGLAVARSIELLAELGVKSAIVNAGGDLMTLGRPAHRAWRIGIRDPRGKGVLGSVDLDGGEALFTSGDYERGYLWEGVAFHHVIDPRTGYPSRGLAAATVLHSDPVLADAGATTLMVAGPQDWPEHARRLGIDLAMVVLPDGSVELTPPMAERVEFQGEPTRRLRTEGFPAGAGWQ